MSIIIGADLVPTKSNYTLFNNGNADELVGNDLLKILYDSDFRVFNLETPLTDAKTTIKKNGPALCTPRSTISGIKALRTDLVALANNHIMDQGTAGLYSTFQLLDDNRIRYIGAGCDAEQALQPTVINVKGKKIGFYTCVEHEFSLAGSDTPGANPFDVFESYDHIEKLKKTCDFVVVLYHGGKEYYRYPSPFLQRVCRKFVQSGADLVICQHSHCIGCEEKYGNGTIVYGQGNFIFSDCFGPVQESSLLVNIKDDFSIEYIPLLKTRSGVRLAVEKQAEKILLDFRERSEQIKQVDFIQKEYAKLARRNLNGYMLATSGYYHKFFQRFFNKLSGYRLTKFFGVGLYKERELLAIRNYIECESHRELWIWGLKGYNVNKSL